MTYKKRPPKKDRKFSYLHYGVLLFPQGAWTDKDEESVKKMVRDDHKETPNLFQSSYPSNCNYCNQTHELLQGLLGKNKGLIYVGHVIYLENDEMKVIAKFLDHKKVKKIYLFQGGPLQRNEISVKSSGRIKSKDIVIKDRLKPLKVTKIEFYKIIDETKFEEEVIYEIFKTHK